MKFRHLKLSHIFINLKRLLSVSFLPQFIKNFNFEKHITATLLHKRVINKIISKLVIEKILENRKIPNTHQLKSTCSSIEFICAFYKKKSVWYPVAKVHMEFQCVFLSYWRVWIMLSLLSILSILSSWKPQNEKHWKSDFQTIHFPIDCVQFCWFSFSFQQFFFI